MERSLGTLKPVLVNGQPDVSEKPLSRSTSACVRSSEKKIAFTRITEPETSNIEDRAAGEWRLIT